MFFSNFSRYAKRFENDLYFLEIFEKRFSFYFLPPPPPPHPTSWIQIQMELYADLDPDPHSNVPILIQISGFHAVMSRSQSLYSLHSTTGNKFKMRYLW